MKATVGFGLAFACALIVWPGDAARAVSTKSAEDAALKLIDADKSGTIPKDEFKAGRDQLLKEAFVSLDTDKDGELSAQEFARGVASPPPLLVPLPSFQKMDTDGNRKLDEQEFAFAQSDGWDKVFAQLDKDDDGTLTIGKERSGAVMQNDDKKDEERKRRYKEEMKRAARRGAFGPPR